MKKNKNMDIAKLARFYLPMVEPEKCDFSTYKGREQARNRMAYLLEKKGYDVGKLSKAFDDYYKEVQNSFKEFELLYCRNI